MESLYIYSVHYLEMDDLWNVPTKVQEISKNDTIVET